MIFSYADLLKVAVPIEQPVYKKSQSYKIQSSKPFVIS